MSKKKDNSPPAKPGPKASPATTAANSTRSLPIPSLLQILVECKSESQQQDLFERLRAEGCKCRLLTL